MKYLERVAIQSANLYILAKAVSKSRGAAKLIVRTVVAIAATASVAIPVVGWELLGR